MAEWDASAISAVAALLVAVVALFIALAQAIQQYLITGQRIRLCDSVVFGPMPGQGRRVWQTSQFRFRVIYSIPQISLRANLWPSGGGAILKSHAVGEHELPRLAPLGPPGFGPDVASMPGVTVMASSLGYTSETDSIAGLPWWRGLLRPFQKMRRRRGSVTSEESEASSVVQVRAPVDRAAPPPPSPPPPGFPLERPLPPVLPPSGFLRRRRPHSDTSSTKSPSSFSDTSIASSVKAPLPSPEGIGEASWVSFCRAIEQPCGSSVRIDFVTCDADRCPSDLVSAPMQTSMRDVVIMALMAGMELTHASFEDKSVSMQGAVGTLTSSSHPVLGPVLHFTPQNIDASVPKVFGFRWNLTRGSIDKRWMARTWDVCSVANTYYTTNKRRTTRRLDERWLQDQKGASTFDIYASGSRRRRPRKGQKKAKAKAKTEVHNATAKALGREGEASREAEHRHQGSLSNISGFVPPGADASMFQGSRSQDGHWTLQLSALVMLALDKRARGLAQARAGKEASEEKSPSGQPPTTPVPPPTFIATEAGVTLASGPRQESDHPPKPSRRPTVQEVPDEGEKEIKQEHYPGPSTVNITEKTPTPGLSGQVPSTGAEGAGPGTEPPTQGSVGVEAAPDSTDDDDGDDSDPQVDGGEPSIALADRAKAARKLQASRAKRLRKIQKDQKLIEDSVKRGAMSSPSNEVKGRLLLTNYAHNPGQEVSGGAEDDVEPTKEEEEAQKREKERTKQRQEREDAREQRNLERNRAIDLIKVDVFWLSQVDVMLGYWATPWHDEYQVPLSITTDGAITVILEALLGFLDERSLLYTDSNFTTRRHFQDTARAVLTGSSTVTATWPAYAQNGRGGVIVNGTYQAVLAPAFRSVIPALELLHSYEWQTHSIWHDRDAIEDQNIELMRLDAWLSYVGRTEEISSGPHRLLKQCPALVHLLMQEFELDFQNIDLSAKEGGLQDIQGLTANVMDFLTDEGLHQAEQLYVLVALLRTMKVAQCVLAGSDTRRLRTILERDVQVHLV